MIDLGQHAEFIVWGYVGVAVACLALAGWVAWRNRMVKARLARLEAQGVRRRSAASGPGKPTPESAS